MRDDVERLFVAVLVIGGFYYIGNYVVTHGISDTQNGTTVALLVGAMMTGLGTVVGWYFTNRAKKPDDKPVDPADPTKPPTP